MDNETYIYPNYYHRMHLAWLKHCATIVKPCGKEINEVVTYLTDNYDTEPMTRGQLGEYIIEFASRINCDRSLDISERTINKMSLSESDMDFTIASMTTARYGSQPYERISKDIFLQSMRGCKIPMTKRNIKRITEIASLSRIIPPNLYKGYSCGYVFWDESLPHFYAKDYGCIEIADDLRFYHGVTIEDIRHLTYRFSRFTQLFPRGDYYISLYQFENDMDMCRKYGFYNNQRLFTEMLDATNIRYEFLREPTAKAIKQKWHEQFVPPHLQEYAKEHCYFNDNGFAFAGPLWNIFSCSVVDCLEKKQAAMAFDTKQKGECIVFFTGYDYAFKLNAESLNAKILEDFKEVYITNIDFTWTYVYTHDVLCGPYFHELGAEYPTMSW